MKNTRRSILTILLLVASPTLIREDPASPLAATPRVVREAEMLPAAPSPALEEFKAQLATERRDIAEHGIYVETLDSGEPLVALNENTAFNPASVIKLATTLGALERLGPQHRFRTEFRAAGEIDPRRGELKGDLILDSGGDPSFSIPDARQVGDHLRSLGVRHVSGQLVVRGPFNCNYNSQTDVSTGVFLRQSRLAIAGGIRYEEAGAEAAPGRLLLAVESDALIHLLQHQNAHSVNSMADMLSLHLGGAEGLREFLLERVGLPGNNLFISRASGLDVNRLSARDTVRLLRALVAWLDAKGYPPQSVMPVAGIDASTLADRFLDPEYAGSVIAKTGTLHGTDGGVAALAGVAYTLDRGPLLFAIFDMAEGRNVLRLRQLQDELLRRIMEECGGPLPLARRDREEIPWTPASRILKGEVSPLVGF